MDKIAPISEVRSHLPAMVSLMGKKKRQRIIITRGGHAAAVLISVEELETLEVLADKKLMASLLKAEEEVREGHMVTYDDVFK